MQLPNSNNENDIHITFGENNKGTCSVATIDFEFISPKQVITISLLHTGNISLGKWMIKDGKVLESNEILDETDSKNSHIIFKPLYLSIGVTIIISILSNIFVSISNIQKLEMNLQNLQNNNYQMSNYIDELQQKIQDLEDDISILNQYSHDNSATIQ